MMDTKEEIIERILSFTESDNTPLRFSPKLGILRRRSLDNLVFFLMKVTRLRESVHASNGRLQTSRDRRRSSKDIWRHVIFYKKDVTLPEVMGSLWRLVEDGKLLTCYCKVIKRRVFRPLREFDAGTKFDTRKHDEYGIPFSMWETINE